MSERRGNGREGPGRGDGHGRPLPSALFRRFAHEGWLVLSGGVPSFGGAARGLADHLLTWTDLSRPLLLLGPEAEPEETVIDLAEDLAALFEQEPVSGALADIAPEDLRAAGLIVLAPAPAAHWVRVWRGFSAPDPSYWLDEGSLLFALGGAAAALATWGVTEVEPLPVAGLGWLEDTLLAAGEVDLGSAAQVREVLEQHPQAFALVLLPEAILALGPENEVEVWSEVKPRIIFGRAWRQG